MSSSPPKLRGQMASNTITGSGREQQEQQNAHALVLEHVLPATRLMEKRRQTLAADEQLAHRRELFLEKEMAFNQREAVIKRKNLELQENLVRFGKFLQENDGKRLRAKRRAADEIQLRLRKEAEIESLTEKLRRISAHEELTEDSLAKNERYGVYLEHVLEYVTSSTSSVGQGVEHSMGFREVDDVLRRYTTLQSSNDLLTETHRNFAEEESHLKTTFTQYLEEKKDEALTLNNEIAVLKKELENKLRQKEEVRNQRDVNLKNDSQKKMEHGRVCMATENLFRRVRSRSAVKYKNETDPLERLKVIGEYIGDLDRIVKMRYKTDPGLTD